MFPYADWLYSFLVQKMVTSILVTRFINQLPTNRSSVRSNGSRALIAVGDKNSESTPYNLYRQHMHRNLNHYLMLHLTAEVSNMLYTVAAGKKK